MNRDEEQQTTTTEAAGCETSSSATTSNAVAADNTAANEDDHAGGDGVDDDEGEGETQFTRVDSMFSPQILDTKPDATFPVTHDEVIHEPPADLKALFTIPPRLGRYTDLIQSLLRPPVASGAGGAASDSNSRTAGAASSPVASASPRMPEEPAATAAATSASPPHLNRDTVMDICRDVTSVFSDESSLLDINIEEDETLVVVGDVHGQFHDMTHHVLNQQYEKPEGSKDRKFLFLGDYVDRGPQGVETILLLFALKIEYPSQIYLIRGNHEESQTSRVYGFLFEVRIKFNDLTVWARFNEVFCYIPLAATVSAPGHKFFAVHGGLSPTLTDVNAIRDISRVDYGGMLDTTESDIVDGLLWSDPSDAVVRFSRNDRGCGYLFGSAAAHEFCEQNQLDFICRAHQMTLTGYTWAHNHKVLTVFSAPNYCGVSNNLAAIMLVTHEWDLQFVQFAMAPNRQPMAPPPQMSGWSFF